MGREDILQRINKALSDGSGPRYAVLQGISSQGKSQVAMEYCHRKKDVLTWPFFWVDENPVKGSFQSISERIKMENQILMRE